MSSERFEAEGATSGQTDEERAQDELERVVLARDDGPFIPLDPDWHEKVMKTVLERIDGPFVEFTPDDAWMQRIREKAMKRRET